MVRIYYDSDANLEDIRTQRVGIIGYGSQGHAHALNLRDSGVEVRVGLPASSASRAKAAGEGLEVGTPAEIAEWADVVMVVAPDTAQPKLYREELAPHLKPGNTLMFAHGFNIRFGTIEPPEGVDVSMIAPKAPGHRVREVFRSGEGTPGLLAVHVDASGKAKASALAYAKGIGCTRAGVIETSFAEETETDLFGEQAVLCGGVSALVQAGFDTLVDAGYQPEIAYFECMHELKLIVDLMYRGGLTYMRHSVSDTAEHGDYTGGPRVIDERTREAMKKMLEDIQTGRYAQAWIDENEAGRPEFNKTRAAAREHRIEDVGRRLRSMMSFLEPVRVVTEGGKERVEADVAEVTS